MQMVGTSSCPAWRRSEQAPAGAWHKVDPAFRCALVSTALLATLVQEDAVQE